MKKLSALTTIAMLTALALGLSQRQALAGATAAGTTCEPVSGGGIEYQTTAAAVNGTGTIVTCPIVVDHTLGTSVTFRVWVGDGSNSGNFKCNGYIHGAGGGLLAVTPDITFPTCAAPPSKCKGEAQTSVPSQNAGYMYTVQCMSPGSDHNYSSIESVRVY